MDMLSYITNAMKVKVLYVVTKSDVGGAQKYVADLAAHLDAGRFETKILSGGRDLRRLSNRTLPLLLFANDWLAVAELVRAFRRERPDVIHLNSSKAGVVGSLAAGIYKLLIRLNPKPYTLNPRVVFTAHGWVFNPSNYYAAPVRWCYAALHRVAARFCDVIINVSAYDRNLALCYSIAPVRKLVTIHNGIDPNIPFLSCEEARKEIKRRINVLYPKPYTLNPAHPWAGSIGRLTKEKDYATLVAAAALVPDSYFFVIGSGPELKKLQVTRYKLHMDGRFFLVPPTGDDARLLKAFDVFALSSVKEGLPYVLLEAMAAGRPIVVTETGGMPEAIRNRRQGFVVPQQNPASLASAIREFVARKDEARAFGEAARTAVREEFNLRNMAACTAAVYSENL